ncbi:hypothetical protein CONLIGDRAFT_694541 [Coniochaeta ligniaria NRRL 30616]|uniref:C2H2-type domain-containing protein n=1 Tax=Coniochaeta ligniaria NRRL 30616 TaxID=1408157 RepID=A0A1J7I5T9_9PEZI|nr:hypothetical protein CONLIGDRAFT_694541 [Coniochaeta ligniaria NRRL 30616]
MAVQYLDPALGWYAPSDFQGKFHSHSSTEPEMSVGLTSCVAEDPQGTMAISSEQLAAHQPADLPNELTDSSRYHSSYPPPSLHPQPYSAPATGQQSFETISHYQYHQPYGQIPTPPTQPDVAASSCTQFYPGTAQYQTYDQAPHSETHFNFNAPMPLLNTGPRPSSFFNTQPRDAQFSTATQSDTAMPPAANTPSPKTSQTGQGKIPCPKCDVLFTNKQHLERHDDTKHADIRKFFCPVDDCKYQTKGFPRKDALKTHMKNRHKGVRNIPWEDRFYKKCAENGVLQRENADLRAELEKARLQLRGGGDGNGEG